jgi:hypothetical protein
VNLYADRDGTDEGVYVIRRQFIPRGSELDRSVNETLLRDRVGHRPIGGVQRVPLERRRVLGRRAQLGQDLRIGPAHVVHQTLENGLHASSATRA